MVRSAPREVFVDPLPNFVVGKYRLLYPYTYLLQTKACTRNTLSVVGNCVAVGLLALLIVGRAVVISRLFCLVCCCYGLDCVVRYFDARLSCRSAMLLMWVSPSDSISFFCPILDQARVLPSWWGIPSGRSFIAVTCHLLVSVPLSVLMSPTRRRCVLLGRNVAPVPVFFCCDHFLMNLLFEE